LIFLPTYSPNLNLIERLWKVMNKAVLYNRYYEKFAHFKKAIMDFFQNIKDYKDEIQRILTFKLHLVRF
jgi:transposase